MKELKGLTPSDCLNILWRRRWYAVITFLLIVSCVVAYEKMLPDLYISTSKILVEQPSVPRDYVRPSDASTPSQLIDTAIQRIQSRFFIEQLIQDFELIGYGTSEEFLMEDAVATVRKHIKATKSANTLSISYTSMDPQLAQKVNKRIVEMLIQFGSSNRKSLAKDTLSFLEKDVQENDSALKKQEEKIKQFKLTHMGQLPEHKQQNADTLRQLTGELEGTENDLEELRMQNRLLDTRVQDRLKLGPLIEDLYQTDSTPSISGMNSESLTTLNAKLAAKEAELNELKTKYSLKHPDVIRASNEVDLLKQQLDRSATEAASDKSASTQLEEADEDLTLDMDLADFKIQAEIIKNDIERLEKKRESLTSQIQMYEDSANMAPELETQLTALNRERNRLEQQYLSSINKRDQAQRTLDLEEEDAGSYSIMDEASLPERPGSPNRIQILLMGLLAGLVAGIGASFGRELLDTTLSTEEEVAAALKMPVLVSVNEISKRDARRHASKKNIA